MATQMVALPLQMMMRLDDTEVPRLNEMLEDMPQPPSAADFMSDDGTMTEESQALLMDAMTRYQEEVQAWGARTTAIRTRAQFEHATALSDLDGDGRLSPDEWDARANDLFAERDERLFLAHYDLDSSGTVDPVELETFLDWYHNDSLRADVNYDGRVDKRDLEEMLDEYGG
ncbi:MAG: hypothetical protein KDA28_04245, partial [Phycisphaerales bacterium]|nr:hypothetical protein [Phycisphaerales bacterium]